MRLLVHRTVEVQAQKEVMQAAEVMQVVQKVQLGEQKAFSDPKKLRRIANAAEGRVPLLGES
jgi:hypothetical protein